MNTPNYSLENNQNFKQTDILKNSQEENQPRWLKVLTKLSGTYFILSALSAIGVVLFMGFIAAALGGSFGGGVYVYSFFATSSLTYFILVYGLFRFKKWVFVIFGLLFIQNALFFVFDFRGVTGVFQSIPENSLFLVVLTTFVPLVLAFVFWLSRKYFVGNYFAPIPVISVIIIQLLSVFILINVTNLSNQELKGEEEAQQARMEGNSPYEEDFEMPKQESVKKTDFIYGDVRIAPGIDKKLLDDDLLSLTYYDVVTSGLITTREQCIQYASQSLNSLIQAEKDKGIALVNACVYYLEN